MTSTLFIHQSSDHPTTVSEFQRIHELVEPTDTLNMFAYATQSGLATFELELTNQYWETNPSRWLFGIDYGRTQPQAIRSICEKPNTEVRIYDGEWLVTQAGFLPRRDFHIKTSFLSNPDNGRFGAIIGSGNFSSNGLRKSIEAGASVYINEGIDQENTVLDNFDAATALWDFSTPAEDIIEEYEHSWNGSFSRSVNNQQEEIEPQAPQNIFWIETGHVTQNRGANRPGNQIDLPRGMSQYFGFPSNEAQPLNSIIGEITFLTPVGEPTARNIRLGNNAMEKITLPIPETHGFDIYDGKVLVFRRTDTGFFVNALEASDFEATFGDRLTQVRAMGSGRRYGHIE